MLVLIWKWAEHLFRLNIHFDTTFCFWEKNPIFILVPFQFNYFSYNILYNFNNMLHNILQYISYYAMYYILVLRFMNQKFKNNLQNKQKKVGLKILIIFLKILLKKYSQWKYCQNNCLAMT